MNISLILGWVLSFGAILYGILSTGSPLTTFVDIASFLIVILGGIGSLIASYPLSMLKDLPKIFKIAFFPKKINHRQYINDIVEYGKTARSKGLISLEATANEVKDPFLRSSLLLIIDANDTEKVRSMLDDAVFFLQERHAKVHSFFDKGVAMFPAFGMLGTVISLVIMLMEMGDGGAGDIGPLMSVALITTFYGSVFANVVFAPISMALKNASEDEVLCMQIIEEGVIAIAGGSNPRYIQEKLEFMLPKQKGKKQED